MTEVSPLNKEKEGICRSTEEESFGKHGMDEPELPRYVSRESTLAVSNLRIAHDRTKFTSYGAYHTFSCKNFVTL